MTEMWRVLSQAVDGRRSNVWGKAVQMAAVSVTLPLRLITPRRLAPVPAFPTTSPPRAQLLSCKCFYYSLDGPLLPPPKTCDALSIGDAVAVGTVAIAATYNLTR